MLCNFVLQAASDLEVGAVDMCGPTFLKHLAQQEVLRRQQDDMQEQ